MVSEQEKFIGKKAYEIAYALFRISGKIGAQPLARYLENHGLSLFDSAIYGNKESAAKESQIIEYYLRLGGDIGLIHQDNVAVLISEIGKLSSIVSEVPKATGPAPMKLHFSQEPKFTADIQKKEVPAEVINREIEAIANTEFISAADGSGNNIEQSVQPIRQTVPPDGRAGKPQLNGIELRQFTRHAAIMDKIRQLPNCRMKELQEAFPAVSERTLRYDLEKLSERGLIERLGPGGPATFYRVKSLAELPAKESVSTAGVAR